MFEKVIIIGAGYMGGSLALAVKRRKIARCVIGLARNEKRAKQIRKFNIFDEVKWRPGEDSNF